MTTLPTLDTARRWRDLPLVATDGAQVGLIEGIYVDEETGRPEWALVDLDDAARRAFVSLAGAGEEEGKVRVPCERERITGAPPLPAVGTLSRMEETRLYDHYGIAYSTAASPSVLPAGEADPSDLDHPLADDELDGVGSTLDAQPGGAATDATSDVQATFATEPLVTGERAEAVEVPPARGRARLASRALALAGLTAAGLAVIRRRSRGSRSGTRAEVTRQMNRSKRRAARAGRRVEEAPAQLAEAGTRVARAAAKTAEAAARQAAKRADKTRRKAAKQAGETGRKAARAAEETRRRATKTAEKARRRAADATGDAVDAAGSAARTAGDAAGTVVGLPAAAAGAALERLGQAAPRRRGKGKKKRKRTLLGRFGLAAGAAVGYVLGTKAGRERYDQMVGAAKQLGERPEVKRIVEQAPGAVDTAVGQAADKAADRLGQARDRLAPDKPTGPSGEGAGPPA
ncbi:MAG TPA: PRC-barrel domain-containing protein [Actinomycetes bacterium]